MKRSSLMPFKKMKRVSIDADRQRGVTSPTKINPIEVKVCQSALVEDKNLERIAGLMKPKSDGPCFSK